MLQSPKAERLSFVSHNLQAVAEFCIEESLERGLVVADGPTDRCRRYLDTAVSHENERCVGRSALLGPQSQAPRGNRSMCCRQQSSHQVILEASASAEKVAVVIQFFDAAFYDVFTPRAKGWDSPVRLDPGQRRMRVRGRPAPRRRHVLYRVYCTGTIRNANTITFFRRHRSS